ncbi:heme biosynthesis HemY N-terminal domain-containing protein [Vibrio sp. 10N.261.55.A7]|uniref:heme biosynthesis protein HemY n=1 Tax=Vibrio sp. 10N.261.55.A7 TaxID=1880851 RepID=UPI000C85F440|nr:heme biosynthesis HemY N-terminal domain-containing protein [Vibrio sp. 10N.261.55.A7]PMK02807.1 heme biosynthesis protein HemY [Vibrio sp. 10N.261.55.A7]
MFRSIFLFVVLGLGLFAGTQYAGQQGYVLISVADKTIEMSVTTLVIFIIASLAALFFLEFIIKKILRTSSTTWNWFSVRKLKRSRRFTNEGIIKLLEGDWKVAEKKVMRWANHHDMPLLCYLVASEAAQGMGDKQRRDQYLSKASEQENSRLAVELTRAKQQVREAEYELAFDTLSSLKNEYPNNTILLNLLKVVYLQLQLWQPLLELVPKLSKHKLIESDEQESILEKAQCGLLSDIATQKGSEGLIAHWDQLPKKVKGNTHLIGCFIKQLIARKADNDAYIVLKESLKKHASPELFSLLPEINLADTHPAIQLLTSTLKKDKDNATAHSALAQFYLRESNWGKAQEHLEIALSIRSNVSDYAYLADTLEKQNLPKAAHEVSKKALMLVNNS